MHLFFLPPLISYWTALALVSPQNRKLLWILHYEFTLFSSFEDSHRISKTNGHFSITLSWDTLHLFRLMDDGWLQLSGAEGPTRLSLVPDAGAGWCWREYKHPGVPNSPQRCHGLDHICREKKHKTVTSLDCAVFISLSPSHWTDHVSSFVGHLSLQQWAEISFQLLLSFSVIMFQPRRVKVKLQWKTMKKTT